jgi:hypothetical protein
MTHATGENIFMINESFMSILPQEARTPAVFHTVMESAETFSSQSISYTRPTIASYKTGLLTDPATAGHVTFEGPSLEAR